VAQKSDVEFVEGEGVDIIDVAQDSDKWLTFVNTVMNLPVP
jgi:hypothetical protein